VSSTNRHLPNQITGFNVRVVYQNSVESCNGTLTGYASNNDDCNDANTTIY